MPGDDVEFLDARLPVGMEAAQARALMDRRRFTEMPLKPPQGFETVEEADLRSLAGRADHLAAGRMVRPSF